MKVDSNTLITTLRYGNQLKRTARTGWVQRGVANAEDVAAHSYGTAFAAMILAEALDDDLDKGRMLSMALLHDLPESLTSDIPTPSWVYLPPGSKSEVEEAAMDEIFAQTEYGRKMMDLWRELQAAQTAEAMIVHDADKIDMFLQAVIYEESTGNKQLEEFWTSRPQFNLSISQEIYEQLLEGRRSP
ncbi:MAG TPA: HD domain-containing protein [candidate division Zixibacteria bacterium]|nr:HD domain-containing protein [candidate division Zixibacteria bacterium]